MTHQPVLILPRNSYGKNRSRWHAVRHAGITATDIPVILGVSPYNSPLGLFIDKTTPAPAGDEYLNESAEWGQRLERVVAEAWAAKNKDKGIIVPSPGVLAHPQHEWLLATIDRYIAPNRKSEPTAVLEVKTTSADWPEGADLPNHIVAQVMTQIAVTGLDVAHVAALHLGRGKKFRQWTVERDDDLITAIITAATAFRQAVLDNEPPAPIGHEADAEALKILFPGDADLPPVALPVELIEQRRAAAKALVGWEAELERIDQTIKSRMGNATEATDPDGHPAFTWRPSVMSAFDKKALAVAHPELVEEFTTRKTIRRFVDKAKKES